MKQKCYLLFMICFVLITFDQSYAQLLEENFDYTVATNLTDNGWISFSGEGVSPIVIESSNLSFLGYPSSGIGGSIIVDDNGEDVYYSLSSSQTSGSIYVSLLINAANATTASGGDYFFALGSS